MEEHFVKANDRTRVIVAFHYNVWTFDVYLTFL